MDKIEPNDIVLIIAGDEFTGRVCTAVEKVMGANRIGWRLDPPTMRRSGECIIDECGLRKINDPDIQKQIEIEEWKGEAVGSIV